MDYPIVKLTWTTSSRTFAELTTSQVEKANITVVDTVGYLVLESEFFLVLARDITNYSDNRRQFRDVITIPKIQIKEQVAIPQPNEETT